MTSEDAIALAKTEFWKDMTHRQIAEFQMMEEKACMPFSVFHEAMEKTIGRPIWIHEFVFSHKDLKVELFEGKAPPTMEEIINLIPAEKRIIIQM
jgi:hypothetical protein